MKKLLLLALLFFITKTKAQFVTIPDTAFVNYLHILIPGAINGNQLDTTNALVTTTTHTINVSKKHIVNLNGIQYFNSLTFLRCDSNKLTTLPTLPTSLNYLKCNNQYYDTANYTVTTFTSLPTLPNTLTYLDCSGNDISSLPVLPISLTYLNCSSQSHSNQNGPYYPVLSSLPNLPASLTYLNCSFINITALPPLPASLTYLNCSGNNITALPPLPNTLKFLDCGYTSLPSLTTLPNALTHLSCNNIGITTFTTLPALPNTLSFLDCSVQFCIPCSGPPPPQGPITILPALPNHLDTLICGYNRITCFQPFPTSITFIDINGNNNYCLPNYIPAMSHSDTTYFPLCGIGSPCPISPRCTSTVSFSLTPDVTPHTWDVSPIYPSNIVKATWFWGDGTYTANALYPSHTYTTPGSYQIGVEIIDALNCYTDFSQTDSVYRYANNSTYSNMVYINVKNNATAISTYNTQNSTLSIYPNPTQNNFTVEVSTNEKQTLQVYDVNGKQVLTQTITGTTNIDVSNLSQGVYNISITNSAGVTNKRIVIVK